jgi:hypothetical protein
MHAYEESGCWSIDNSPPVQVFLCTEPIEKLYTPPRAAGFPQEPRSAEENGASLLVITRSVDFIDERHFSSTDPCSRLNDSILPSCKCKSLCFLPLAFRSLLSAAVARSSRPLHAVQSLQRCMLHALVTSLSVSEYPQLPASCYMPWWRAPSSVICCKVACYAAGIQPPSCQYNFYNWAPGTPFAQLLICCALALPLQLPQLRCLRDWKCPLTCNSSRNF